MIERYTRPEMGNMWSDETKYKTWLQVELAVCQAQAEAGEFPVKIVERIQAKADSFFYYEEGKMRNPIERILEIEKEVKHDVIAFLTALSEHIGEDSRFIHKGMTSADLTDTTQAILMKEAVTIILDDIRALLKVLKEKAVKYKHLPCIGRTHGIYAEPMSFGLKFLSWYSEMWRNLIRCKRLLTTTGKIAGPIGTYSNISPEIEEKALKKLGLIPEDIATQIIPRDYYADYISTLAIVAASTERIATEIRHLQRTEVGEVAEGFSKEQKGSSAMPHKRNPIGTENLCGLARIVRANVQPAMENIALWHERDISHSSTERVILPDSTILVNYMLNRLKDIITNLDIYEDRIQKNLDEGLELYCSQSVMLALVEKGRTREKAYKVVQKASFYALENRVSLKTVCFADNDIVLVLTDDEIHKCFDTVKYYKNVNYIYKRVLE